MKATDETTPRKQEEDGESGSVLVCRGSSERYGSSVEAGDVGEGAVNLVIGGEGKGEGKGVELGFDVPGDVLRR